MPYEKINIAYWIVTGLFAAFMGLTSIPNLLSSPDSVAFLSHLGYPAYLLPFLGVAKILGAVAILISGFPRIKEWAYAGLMIDLAGALYSVYMVDGLNPGLIFIFIPLLLGVCSYILYHKKYKASSRAVV